MALSRLSLHHGNGDLPPNFFAADRRLGRGRRLACGATSNQPFADQVCCNEHLARVQPALCRLDPTNWFGMARALAYPSQIQ